MTTAVTGSSGMDPRGLVGKGYEQIAERYLDWEIARASPVRRWLLTELLERLPARSHVLELGCGAGVPVGRAVAERHGYVGVDLAWAQLALAQRHLPGASLVRADITQMHWRDGSFDAVVAFYVFNHLPPAEVEPTVARIARWLRPGGVFAATLPGGDSSFEGVEDDWLGVPMYFSGITTDLQDRILTGSGLTTELAEVREENEGDTEVRFRWVIARKR